MKYKANDAIKIYADFRNSINKIVRYIFLVETIGTVFEIPINWMSSSSNQNLIFPFKSKM